MSTNNPRTRFFQIHTFNTQVAALLQCVMPPCPCCSDEKGKLVLDTYKGAEYYKYNSHFIINCSTTECQFSYGPFEMKDIFTIIDKLIYKFNNTRSFFNIEEQCEAVITEMGYLKDFISDEVTKNNNDLKYLNLEHFASLLDAINDFTLVYNKFKDERFKL